MCVRRVLRASVTPHASRLTQHASRLLRAPMIIPLALYLHIPFCAVRCAYCGFNTYAGLERLYEPYAAALIREIRRGGMSGAGRRSARSSSGGGRRPCCRRAPGRRARPCREAFDVAADAEITSEANPGTVDQAHFAALAGMGVNRLSMGVQSFDDGESPGWAASTTPRRPTRPSCRAAAGFANINLDFIFGLPDQDPATWTRTLARAIEPGAGAPLALQPHRGTGHPALRAGAPRRDRRAGRRPCRRSVRVGVRRAGRGWVCAV